MVWKFCTWSILLVCVFTTVLAAVATDKQDADNEGEALGMAAATVAEMEQLRPFCSDLLPKERSSIQRAALAWISRNKIEFLAVSNIRKEALAAIQAAMAAGVEVVMLPLRAAPRDRQEAYCQYVFGSRVKDIANETPRASRLVSHYVDEHPALAGERDRLDFVLGCEIRRANDSRKTGAQFDLDEAVAVCECVHDEVWKSTTPEERQELEHLEQLHQPITQSIAYPRVTAAAAGCATAGQNTR